MFCLQFFCLIQAVIICLKIDEIIDWKWREALFAYWIGLIVIGSWNIGLFLILLVKFGS